jgi:hypothetical protein
MEGTMTHYTVDYSDCTPQDKYKRALGDVIDYMGTVKFSKMVYAFRQHPEIPVDHLAFYLSLGGIQGYPVQALHDHFWPYG